MRVLLALLILTMATPLLAEQKVHEYQLDNGMKVIVKEDHRAPIVVSQVWYKVGSSYEYGGISGVSHVLEHMMFKGTTNHPPGEFSRIIAANGGRENAFTGRDYTAYFQTLAKDRLEISLELEADRMRNLTLPEDEFLKEVEVVKEERRMRTEDNPESLTYEQFNTAAWQASPYRIPVIGWMSDLDAMTVDDLRHWYQLWYAPNNATLVVVGDVDPQNVLALAKRYFGPHKAEKRGVIKPRTEPRQRGAKRIVVKAPAQQPYLVMGYKVPVVKQAGEAWEPYALDMLVSVLDGGGSARFAKNLVRGEQIAVSAGASYNLFTRLQGLLLIDGSPAPGFDMAQLEAALLKEIDKLKHELVSQEELERITTQVVAAKVYERDSVFYQAMQLGMLETVGLDWRLNDEVVERLKAVTPEQVQMVAKKYLIEDNLTFARLDPQPMDEASAKRQMRAAAGGGHGR